MRWRVEVITNESSNILIDDEMKDPMDQEPVGMGFPLTLAERIVKLHNEDADKAAKTEEYEKLRAMLEDLPMTWYPDLLRAMTEAAYKKNVFVPGGASNFVREVEKKNQYDKPLT